MVILDTDMLSLLERANSSALALQMRLDQIDESEIVTSIITYEEQMRGWLAHSAQANTTERMLIVYARIQRHLQTFRDLTVLPFDLEAAQQFERLRQARVRIGAMDLKIASICLANDATLLTRNSKDFGQVPGLKFEDWSA